MTSVTGRVVGVVTRAYTMLEVVLIAVFMLGAGVSMYWLVIYALHLVGVRDPEVFKAELIHLIDLGIYTLIFLDLARVLVASVSTKRFSLEGVMEVGILAMIREFIGLTAAEKPLTHIATVSLVFVILFTAWALTRTRIAQS